MTRPAASGWRCALAALLTVVTVLAGAGRFATPTVGPADLASILRAPICHSGGSGGSAGRRAPDGSGDPAAPAPHSCCDDCALSAAAVLPPPPASALPAAPAAVVERAAAPVPSPDLPRRRGPRQPRAPPRA